MILLSKTVTLIAAHHFVGHPIPEAATPHWHQYQITGTIVGNPGAFGMLVDLSIFGAHLATVVAMLQADDLNSTPDLGAPSLENLATWIGDRLEFAAVRWTVVAVRVARLELGEAAEWRAAPASAP